MPDLNCTKFETQLAEAVESRQSPGSESAVWKALRAHAGGCAHCRELWNQFALLDRVLPAWKDHVPPVDLADAVMSRLQSDQPTSSPPPNRRLSWSAIFSAGSLAAVVVLAGVLYWHSRQQPEAGLPPTVPVAEVHPETPSPLPEESLNPPEDLADENWQVLAQQAGTAYLVLAHDAAESLATAKVLVPARKTPAQPLNPKPKKPASPWVKGIGSGLKPIGQDVHRAMGFLFDVLPEDNSTI